MRALKMGKSEADFENLWLQEENVDECGKPKNYVLKFVKIYNPFEGNKVLSDSEVFDIWRKSRKCEERVPLTEEEEEVRSYYSLQQTNPF